MIYTALAILSPDPDNPARKEGYIGAFAACMCEADCLSDAVRLIESEFNENGYGLIGFEYIADTRSLDRELTPDEQELVSLLQNYRVQFKNIHLHKADA